MDDSPLILYVPGMLPKPDPERHREQLLRCLLASMRAVDSTTADALASRPGSFDIVAWTYDFYREHRDIAEDLGDIAKALEKGRPDERDIAEAESVRRRFARGVHLLGDRLPFLIPRLANEKVTVHIRDLRRYTRNENDIGEHLRRLVKLPIEAANAAGRPVLLLAHSMGSIICWDALWELSRRDHRDLRVSLWMTMGSPLGGNYLQKRLKGLDRSGDERFPANVDRWVNVAAVGELTALDRRLRNDFSAMIDAGLIADIADLDLHSFYRSGGSLNVHNEYGYLMHEVTAGVVCDWWAKVS